MSESKPNESPISGRSVYRILDAAADRGREAIRVIEDAARFLADDERLSGQLKQFRHQYAELTSLLPWEKRLGARETESDVGVCLEGSGEYRRGSLETILAANFCRLQESLRSLEEYAKLAVPEMARRAEQLRYASYTLQKQACAFFSAASSRLVRLAEARLYVIVETGIPDEAFLAVARAGAGIFQLRDKHASDRELYTAGRRLVSLLDEEAARTGSSARPLLIVNDRADIALAVGADGVHLGQSELPAETVRAIVGPEMILGVSTANLQQAQAALSLAEGPARVDYLGAGAVFPTATKTDACPAGLEYLRALADKQIQMPVYAIGGINAGNLPQVLETGISRVCVAGAVTGKPDMGSAAKEIYRVLTHKEP